jgi:hypothetical protein
MSDPRGTNAVRDGGFAAALDVLFETVGGVGEERRSLPPT